MSTITTIDNKNIPINTIVLDIDRTLVHSVEHYLVKDEWKTHFTWFAFDEYIVFLRPYLTEFLTFLFESSFHIAIFTAGSLKYVKSLMKHVFNPYVDKYNKSLRFVLCEDANSMCINKYGKTKHLPFITDRFPSIDYRECLIIDDSSQVKRSNGEQCILVPQFVIKADFVHTFFPQSIDDRVFLDIIDLFKNQLSNQDKNTSL